MNKEVLKEVLRLHKMWISNEEDGKRANLADADLSSADLYGADLTGADLRGADLRGADLRGADLYGAYLGGACLEGAYLSSADLYGADLTGADLRGADLTGAVLRHADLRNADLPKDFYILTSQEYHIQIFKDNVRAGCECHSVEKWLSFTNEEIEAMDGDRALKFYPRLVKIINCFCEDHITAPCLPTEGTEENPESLPAIENYLERIAVALETLVGSNSVNDHFKEILKNITKALEKA